MNLNITHIVEYAETEQGLVSVITNYNDGIRKRVYVVRCGEVLAVLWLDAHQNSVHAATQVMTAK